MTKANLRRDARLAANVPVVLIKGKHSLSLSTVDVSFRGLFLLTDATLPLRSLVRLRIDLSTGPIGVHAMVVHVKDLQNAPEGTHGVGLQFWGLGGDGRRSDRQPT